MIKQSVVTDFCHQEASKQNYKLSVHLDVCLNESVLFWKTILSKGNEGKKANLVNRSTTAYDAMLVTETRIRTFSNAALHP